MRRLTLADPDYPSRLKTLADAPPVLYVTGQLDRSDNMAIAIVGSRKATVAGRLFTERLSRGLAELGFTIVSGLAAGIDAAAHRGALAAGGRTIAVLGCGLDQTYPPEHQKLRADIEQQGAVISEFAPSAPPLRPHFPQRNRLISGLSLGVVVTEAAPRSGSLITARLAAEQGREVFAVPGVAGGTNSQANSLIKQGAKLTETVEDVVEELLPQLSDDIRRRVQQRTSVTDPATTVPLANDETRMLSLLSSEPVHIDDAIGRAALSSAEVSGLLVALEIKGFVRQLPGHFFVRI
jgi:DNA processing protein